MNTENDKKNTSYLAKITAALLKKETENTANIPLKKHDTNVQASKNSVFSPKNDITKTSAIYKNTEEKEPNTFELLHNLFI